MVHAIFSHHRRADMEKLKYEAVEEEESSERRWEIRRGRRRIMNFNGIIRSRSVCVKKMARFCWLLCECQTVFGMKRNACVPQKKIKMSLNLLALERRLSSRRKVQSQKRERERSNANASLFSRVVLMREISLPRDP